MTDLIWPDRTEAEYLANLGDERRSFAWALCNYGGFSAADAHAEALAFYPYEEPGTSYRGLIFHDEAWHWAMLRIHGEGYWRTHPELEQPPREYRDASSVPEPPVRNA